MKKIISLFLVGGVLAGTTSCSDFLAETPKSQLTSEAFPATESQAEQNTNYLYRTGAPSLYSSTGIYNGTKSMNGGYVSGYFDNEYAGQEVVVQYSKNLERTEVNIANDMDGIWDACYRAINVANMGIKSIPEIGVISDEKAEQYIAESKFFRAYNYFYLVRFFGDVPFYTEPYVSMEDMYLERTSSATIYEQIIADLKDAAAVLPNETFYGNNARITSNVANAMLAKVCLQASGYPVQGNYMADAAAAAKAVIASGKHALVSNDDKAMNSSFNKLRTTDGLTEAVYAYEYNSSISNSGWWPASSLPNAVAGWGLFKYSITNRHYGISNGYLNVYDTEEDLRIQPNQFFHWTYTRPDTGEEVDLGGANNWYYYDEEAMLNTGVGTKDVNIIRYSEVLLIAAEALAQTGNVAEAAGYLAAVKARSSMTDKDASSIAAQWSSKSADEFTKEVWAERLREFPLEFKIWDDICRTRMYPQFSESNKGTVSFVNVVGASNNWGKTFQEKDLLWPISTNERQRNPSLTQNPGY